MAASSSRRTAETQKIGAMIKSQRPRSLRVSGALCRDFATSHHFQFREYVSSRFLLDTNYEVFLTHRTVGKGLLPCSSDG